MQCSHHDILTNNQNSTIAQLTSVTNNTANIVGFIQLELFQVMQDLLRELMELRQDYLQP